MYSSSLGLELFTNTLAVGIAGSQEQQEVHIGMLFWVRAPRARFNDCRGINNYQYCFGGS